MAGAFELIADQLADPEAQWSLGTFGAIAEFMRDADEPAEIVREAHSISVVTPRGGIRLEALPGLRPIAFETITTQSWSQRVAFCLPEAESAMNRRAVLSELGPDTGALRAQDRDAALFDLGLGVLQVDCCIRTQSVELINGLREHAGRSLFAPGNPAMGLILGHSPHRVFITRAGRAEVFQGIPAPGGKAPEGPHTHVLPKLLAHGRTHAATEPVPQGWVSCAHLYPAHPLRDGYGRTMPFDAARHAAFQSLLVQFGDPAHVRVKTGVAAALMAGEHPDGTLTERFTRAAVRVALRQARATGASARSLPAWLAAYDAQRLAEDESEELADA
jgi:hypothetical protein